MIKRSICLFVSMLIIICCFGITINAETASNTDYSQITSQSNDWLKVAEDNTLKLYFNISTANLAVESSADGKIWTTQPLVLQNEDELEDGEKNCLKSQLVVEYYLSNDVNYNVQQLNSYEHSVAIQRFEAFTVNKGVRVNYQFVFEECDFEIPVVFKIENGVFSAKIIKKEIKEKGNSRILNIDLLPYFATSTISDEGYILIPDGSGALVSFQSSSKSQEYRNRVYGDDPTLTKWYNLPEEKSICLPVFGMRKNGGAFLGVIEGGEAAASIYANNTVENGYANVGVAFGYRQRDMAANSTVNYSSNEYPVVCDEPMISNDFGVVYAFLTGDSADYSGMANYYREYVTKKYSLKAQDEISEVVLSVLGMTTKKDSFLGIPIRKKVKATDFNQLSDMLTALNGAGVHNGEILLYGWNNGGYRKNDSAKITFDSALGGKKGYKKLAETFGEDFTVYSVKNTMVVYNPTFAFAKSKNFARTLNQSKAAGMDYMLSTLMKSNRYGVSYYLSLDKINTYFESWLSKKYSSYEVALDGVQQLHSDFRQNKVATREDLSKAITKFLSEDDTVTAAVGGNLYTVNADLVYGVPTDSSHYDLETSQVPFYQMVFHGNVMLASVCHNDYDRSLARYNSLLYGMVPHYRVSGINSVNFGDTDFDVYYNTEFSSLKDEIIALSAEYKKLHGDLYSCAITKHEYTNGLSIVTYENGTVLVGNPTDSSVIFNNTKIDSMQVCKVS